MKRLYLVLFFSLLWTTVIMAAPAADYMQSRTVIIMKTTQQDLPAQYMKARLQDPFRFPYYEKKEIAQCLSPEGLNKETLRAIAEANGADLILVPVVKLWYWNEYMSLRLNDRIDEYRYSLSIYAYDHRQDLYKLYTVNGFDRTEASVLTQPQALLQEAMDTLLRKLPYKRIPADRTKISVTIPDWFHLQNNPSGAADLNMPVAI